MKTSLLIFLCFLYASASLSQDMIFFRDGSVKVVKLRLVTSENVMYKIWEMDASPVFDTKANDILSVLYKEGDRKVYNQPAAVKTSAYNPADSSVIYILLDFKNDDCRFPVWFNGRYICTLKNPSRLKYTMHSGGPLRIERRAKKGSQDGPVIDLAVEPGRSYGINILPMYPQALDPNKKFKYDVIVDSAELDRFTRNRFLKCKPFRADDFIMEEESDNPLFK